MVRTYGLTHVAIAVRDLNRATRFYQQVLDAAVVFQNDEMVQLQTPGCHDAIVLERAPDEAGPGGGIRHFGFRLTDPAHIEQAAKDVEAAGGTIRDRGQFCPGEPYLFATDPDGYEIEIWYEV